MSAATGSINTPERPGITSCYPVAAGAQLYAGAIGALDASGHAVPASDTIGLRVVGRIEESVDNTGGIAGTASVKIKEGCFRLGNSATDPVTAASRGKFCFIEDDTTVSISGADERVVAGRIVDVDEDGVWIDTRKGQSSRVPTADIVSPSGDLEELKLALAMVLKEHGLMK